MANGKVDFFNDTGGYDIESSPKGPRATNLVRN